MCHSIIIYRVCRCRSNRLRTAPLLKWHSSGSSPLTLSLQTILYPCLCRHLVTGKARRFSTVRVRLLIIFIITVNVFPLRLSFLNTLRLTIMMVYLNVSPLTANSLACLRPFANGFGYEVRRLHNRTIVNQLITSPHTTHKQTATTGSILLQ